MERKTMALLFAADNSHELTIELTIAFSRMVLPSLTTKGSEIALISM